ncbi:hypothetical protein [Thalassotalea sp. PLHSN55]|uniref:hypothetical protein n=1 Tax=Thalassotalea sp. PLHSN55 TaxID=3435888 RepID=UPI003F858AAF
MQIDKTLLVPHRYSTRYSKIISIVLTTSVLFSLCSLFVYHYQQKIEEHQQSLQFIKAPQVNDLYFLDFRLLSTNQVANQRYKIAKVVAITGNIISLHYGNTFYPHHNTLLNSVSSGQLELANYFSTDIYNFRHQEIENMFASSAIYAAKRPSTTLITITKE